MTDANLSPTFSIIIPTRDRAALFERTLQSVFEQTIDDFEVIIVNDGSSGEQLDAYRTMEARYDARVRFIYLPHRAKGHGPAYSRNVGAASARGTYLCFLDDDDLWIDPDHLRRVRDSVAASTRPIDLYFTDQRAVFPDGQAHPGGLWISGLEARIDTSPDALGNYPVRLEHLLQRTGFAHLNCTVYRRAFFEAIGGMDESLRYENDRDVYLRAIDAAEYMLYHPAVIAQHHIPNPKRADNVSTAVSLIEKKVIQFRICDKAIAFGKHAAMRAYARRAKGYELKNMAHLLMQAGKPREAFFYMREALLVSFTFKWLAYTLASGVRLLLRPQDP
ncbi:glycosyltransferase family 2 protein [Nitrogeniibacter mangrovi]|uniref:Glycosyltransferase family 2 protein n=1 Tax=Nitrogeniibacter mangrovi TaxID=2016596 RepID=A0A6C1B6T7_9RHOO|nr:glycosyltransferase family A protein [Nitrogeniibacter mangrovi]QID18525.1 glycosyltransferase family 2 protein [Nitrogeniibacter mangrovi]